MSALYYISGLFGHLGPPAHADASDLSAGDSLLAGGVMVPQPPQAVTLFPPTLRDAR